MQRATTLCPLLLALLLGWYMSGVLAQPAQQSILVEAVDAVGLTVADMDRSVAFYTNVLSFEPVSDVEVAGDAYEHLQGVFGLRMRVVRLRLGEECIVLTEYLAPGDGRPTPADSCSNDLVHWQTTLVLPNIGVAAQQVHTGLFPLVSTGVVTLPEPTLGFTQGMLVRDPDGHVMQLITK